MVYTAANSAPLPDTKWKKKEMLNTVAEEKFKYLDSFFQTRIWLQCLGQHSFHEGAFPFWIAVNELGILPPTLLQNTHYQNLVIWSIYIHLNDRFNIEST